MLSRTHSSAAIWSSMPEFVLIGRSGVPSSEQSQEAERAEAVVDGDDDDVAPPREVGAVVGVLGARRR